METKAYSRIAKEEPSFLTPEKHKNEKETSKGVPSDSNILSTLTGWLAQLKENKA